MARFFGIIGYVDGQVESSPGVWDEQVVERSYFGDITRDTRKNPDGENLNKDISVGNLISIVADTYANENIIAMRFVEWAGTLWTISEVEVQRPRLLLRLGEVYNGRRATEIASPPE